MLGGGIIRNLNNKELKIRILRIGSIISLVFGILLIGQVLLGKNTSNNVFYINNIPVHQQELKWAIAEEKNKVRSQLIQEQNIKSEMFSWINRYDAKKAYEHLVEKAIHSVTKKKVQQGLAKKAGLIKEIDYDTFHNKWLTTNQYRQEAVEKGTEIIYGPVIFKEKEYYEYEMNNLMLKLRECIQEELKVTDEEIRKVYEENKDYFLNEPLEKVKNHVLLFIAQQAYEDQVEHAINNAKIKHVNEKLILQILKGEGIL